MKKGLMIADKVIVRCGQCMLGACWVHVCEGKPLFIPYVQKHLD